MSAKSDISYSLKTLSGKKWIALAISEAFAGSDVGGLQTTAVRDGDYWVVTGTKKYDIPSLCTQPKSQHIYTSLADGSRTELLLTTLRLYANARQASVHPSPFATFLDLKF